MIWTPVELTDPGERMTPRDGVDDRVMLASVATSVFGAARPTRAGRFAIRDRIGSGGIGSVYRAHDPELDREVALKVLRRDVEDTSQAPARLQREAMALARLNHPNVVTVHEVGTVADELFIAMELVEGVDLRAWAERNAVGSRRRFAKALKLMRQAGRGLAAAHRVGLVHRDFKPSNVLIGDDGRVKVADFGLVTSEGGERIASVPSQDPGQDGLTQTGAMLGTPRFMAPEQQVGAEVDERSDQFSFGVSAWLVLFGVHPWPAPFPMPHDEPPALPESAPRWAVKLLRRCLEADPNRRFESMDAVVAALDRGRVRSAAPWVAAGLGLVASVSVGAEAYRRYDRAQAVAQCGTEGEEVARLWDPQLREDVWASVGGSGDAIIRLVDAYAEDWSTARTDACMRGEVERVWDADVLERAQWCLDGRLSGLRALLGELSEGDRPAAHAAAAAVAKIRAPDACLDVEALKRLPPLPIEFRDAVPSVQAKLDRAFAKEVTGEYEEGLTTAEDALADAEAVGWPPLVARARYRVGTLLNSLGRFEEGERALDRSYFEALEAEALEVAFFSAHALTLSVGDDLERHADALLWSRHAEAVLRRISDPAGLLEAALAQNISGVHLAMGELKKAAELNDHAIALTEAALGPQNLSVAVALHNRATVDRELEDWESARQHEENAIAIYEHVLGAEHPRVGRALVGLAETYLRTGDPATAQTLAQRSVDILEAAVGPDHTDVATSLTALAFSFNEQGQLEQAHAYAERVLAIREHAFGPSHPAVATALMNLAGTEAALGRTDSARVRLERALTIQEETLGVENPRIAAVLRNLAILQYSSGEYEAARGHAKRAVAVERNADGPDRPVVGRTLALVGSIELRLDAIADAKKSFEAAVTVLENALGPDDPSLAESLRGLAHVAMKQGRPEDAVPLAERAVQLGGDPRTNEIELANSKKALAFALWEATERREHALALARQVLEVYEGAGSMGANAAAELREWIEKRAG